MVKPKALTFQDREPLQAYYNDGYGNEYSVARLIDEAKGLKPFDLPLAGIDPSPHIWDKSDTYRMSAHVMMVMEADLDMPIILDWRGAVADGRHRIIKALTEGRPTIKAVRLTWKMTPCRTVE